MQKLAALKGERFRRWDNHPASRSEARLHDDNPAPLVFD
jgi:hypothetical protein